ncbi:hypothetical protein AVEN_164904-1 [Araneus ventricosus]|uniref:Uncharacterized protein n=1 Tax=Araneus ventricosus TaxID=182803 RepID=A0A4Y2DWI6_ARAVE|nr:hypothetical protein AVEN_164904-1 [Araneus ventricosus]
MPAHFSRPVLLPQEENITPEGLPFPTENLLSTLTSLRIKLSAKLLKDPGPPPERWEARITSFHFRKVCRVPGILGTNVDIYGEPFQEVVQATGASYQ